MKFIAQILVLLCFTTLASAEEGGRPYVSIRPLGFTFSADTEVLEQNQDINRGWAVGGSIGASLNDYFKIDLLAIDYAENKYGGSEVDTLTIMPVLKVGLFGGDFALKPYATLGLGASHVNFQFEDTQIPDLDGWGLGWQVGAGVDYPIPSRNLAIGVFYRYSSSVSLSEDWDPVVSDYALPTEIRNKMKAGWEVNYHSIGIEIRFGGVLNP